jgi:demethoxyubiquinone hydroxylase (CLK1/Coq7/Cat5 family)
VLDAHFWFISAKRVFEQMDFAPPDCHSYQSSCTEADWAQCTECSRLVCLVHEEVARVRHAGEYAANTSNVCTLCAQALYERGELSMIRHGYQFINRR